MDAFRYFLMREIPWDADGNFSWERFEQVYNSELANSWGNLGSRVIAMIESLTLHDPDAFASDKIGENTRIADAFIVVDGEPMTPVSDDAIV